MESAEPRLVTYKPLRRCVLQTTDGSFVKLLRPAAATEVAAIYASIETHSAFGPMRVAFPESVDAKTGVLRWRRSPGRTLLEGRMRSELDGLMHRVGYGLGCLQRSRPLWPQRHLAIHELSTLERWVESAAAGFPKAAARLWAALSNVGDAFPSENAVCLVPAHRDFHDGQMLAAGEHLTLLDLDTACMAAPELDVANFVAHLRLAALRQAGFQWEAAAALFVAGRAEADAVELDPDRLSWYEAATLLRLACVHAFRPRWTRISDELVCAAESRLAPIPRRGIET